MAKQRDRGTDKRILIVTILLLLVLVIPGGGVLFAKYAAVEYSENAYVARNFYFESDMLAESSGAVPQYSLKAGVNEISFLLMNHPDNLRFSEVDIDYTVTITGEGINETLPEMTLTGNRKTSEEIRYAVSEPGTYTVTAVATAPYTKTLQAKFTVTGKDEEISINVGDAAGSPNIKVTVTTADYEGDIIITWPAGVVPDNTDPLLRDASGNSCTVHVKKNSEYTFQYFKNNPNSDYSKDITVEKKQL